MRAAAAIPFLLTTLVIMPGIRCAKFGEFWQDPQKNMTADTAAPTSPTTFAAVQGGSTQVNLTWGAATDETTVQSAIVYEICQAATAGTCATFTVSYTTSAGATAFAATGLASSTAYFFRVRARDQAGNLSAPSTEATATTAAPGVVNAPVFSPVAGTYNASQNITITSSTGGATICYAFDPQTPACDATPVCTTGTQYGGPVAVATTSTLKAIACLAGNTDSSVTNGVYTIDALAPNVLTVTSATANGSYGTGANISIQITFDEIVNVTGTPVLQLATASPAQTPASYTSGTGTTTLTFSYTVASGNVSSDLDYAAITSLQLNGGTILDAAGNAANLNLPNPGAANSLGANKAIVVDGAAPSVTLVTASSPDGNYGVGSVIQIEVWFNETLTVTGTPTLALATGSPATTTVAYAFGSGSAILRFNYTISAGNFSADLDYTTTTALALAGGTITDGSGNAAVLTLPAPGGLNSLANSKALVVDGSVPSVTGVTSSVADGLYGQGSVISIRVLFSENVFVGGTPQLTLSTGAPATTTIDYVSGSGTNMLDFQYTVANGNNSGDLDYANTAALGLNGGSIQDAAGNQAVLTLFAPGAAGSLGGNRAIVIDGVAPVISGVLPTGSTSVIDTIVSFNFSETCQSANIIWTQTAGTPDVGSPHNRSLTGGELTLGPHNGIVITNNPALVPGAIYSMQFNCLDAAGNAATPINVPNVTYNPPAPPGWTARTMPAVSGWYKVLHANSQFVAIAYGSTNAATSANGASWTMRSLPVSANWTSLAYGNGTYVALAKTSTIAATSSDAITWTQQTLPVSADWQSLAFGNGLFVAVAYNGNVAATSTDGITWTQRTLPTSANWQSITFGNGIFVAIAKTSTIAATSTDGMTWTQRTLPNAFWEEVTFGNNVFVAIAYNGSSAATSLDGINWTARTMPISSFWKSIAYGNGLFVVITSSTNVMATSTNGIIWTQGTLPSSSNWNSIAFGGGIFSVVSYNTSSALSSP